MLSKQWSDELAVFTRAFAGAAVFGVPLVYTMEMWWIGKSLSINYLLSVLALGLISNLGLTYVAGFRKNPSLDIVVDQAIDTIAVGIVSALVLLFAMNIVRVSDGPQDSVGTILLMSVPLSLGASVSREVFAGRVSRQGVDTSHLNALQGVLSDVGATIIGGVFIGISIAPTDEVRIIAAGLRWGHVLVLMALSLLLTYVIVFASGFDLASPPGAFQNPFTETAACYLLSLLVALSMLLAFERVTFNDPWHQILAETIVLGVPVAIGGAGGRLVV